MTLAPSLQSLTTRETEVLKLIADGRSNKNIAHDLGIAFKTVCCHRERIMSKLNTHNMAELTLAAVRMGVVEA